VLLWIRQSPDCHPKPKQENKRKIDLLKPEKKKALISQGFLLFYWGDVPGLNR
jgi:hypothetical protein